jgi:hypothetical protein
VKQTCETETVVPFLVAMKKKIVGKETNLRKWLKMHKIVLGVNGNDQKRKCIPETTQQNREKRMVMMMVVVVLEDGFLRGQKAKGMGDAKVVMTKVIFNSSSNTILFTWTKRTTNPPFLP